MTSLSVCLLSVYVEWDVPKPSQSQLPSLAHTTVGIACPSCLLIAEVTAGEAKAGRHQSVPFSLCPARRRGGGETAVMPSAARGLVLHLSFLEFIVQDEPHPLGNSAVQLLTRVTR